MTGPAFHPSSFLPSSFALRPSPCLSPEYRGEGSAACGRWRGFSHVSSIDRCCSIERILTHFLPPLPLKCKPKIVMLHRTVIRHPRRTLVPRDGRDRIALDLPLGPHEVNVSQQTPRKVIPRDARVFHVRQQVLIPQIPR